MAPVTVDPDKVREFASKQAFYDWLGQHHDQDTEIWIRIWKKATGKPTITPLEAIDVCLCWGWIDAIRKGLDEQSYLQRYTRRGAKSVWSQINRDNVERLIAEGLMTEHGMRHVDSAKADGRWDAAYGTTMDAPADLLEAIAASPAAQASFAKLSAQNRFALIFRTISLKTPAARARKIAGFVAMLERGETIYPQKTSA
jgi:uncharacterized protein YdeI (YjbR/CyaY-like superfamily)